MESDWKEGLWLGQARSSNELLIGTYAGVVRAWAIRKKPWDEQWDPRLIKEMKGTPRQPNPLKPGTNIPIMIHFDETGGEGEPEARVPARREDKPRAVYIKEWMLEEFGYTGDCPGCNAKRAGTSLQRSHTSECRQRLEEALSKDEKGKKAILDGR